MIFFLIKSIFLVIVNKIPHSKKILEILSNSQAHPCETIDFLTYLIYILLL